MSGVPVVACAVVGSVTGAASGLQHSFLLAFVGVVFGFVIGIATSFALAIPYVMWLIQYEKRNPDKALKGPPALWAFLFWPLFAVMLILAAFISWYAVDLLAMKLE